MREPRRGGWRRPKPLLLIAAGLAAAVSGVVHSLAPARAVPGLPPFCDASRTGVTYGADGVILPVSGSTPIPCLVQVPLSTAAGESHLVLTSAGTIAYQAQGALGDGQTQPGSPGEPPVQIAVSANGGQTWVATGNELTLSMPSPVGIDNTLYRDPATDRLFWVVYGVSSNPPRTTMGRSDDGGQTWQMGSTPCCTEGENPRMLAAAPRVSTPSGSPSVLYYCTNTGQVGGLVFPAGARVCYESLDGGVTWDSGRPLLLKPGGNFLQCNGQGEWFDSLDGYYPTADAAGRLYLEIRCSPTHENFGGPLPSTAYILRSDDEMASWTLVGEAPPLPHDYGLSGNPYKEELRADADGNLYLVRGTGSPSNALYLWISRDGGVTWSDSVKLSIPGTQLSNDPMWQIAVGAPGHLVVDYAATGVGASCVSQTECPNLDMYLVETNNALSDDVLFRGARLNDPDDHTHYMLAGSDYTDVSIGPDGVARAAYPGGYIGWLPEPAGTAPLLAGVIALLSIARSRSRAEFRRHIICRSNGPGRLIMSQTNSSPLIRARIRWISRVNRG